jgi:FkbH-like protein
LSLTAEDVSKTALYAQERLRRDLSEDIDRRGGGIGDYLASLKMKMRVHLDDATHIARLSQLTQKTNQFNLTTRRYTEGDIRGFTESADCDVLAVRVRDRLGDSGIVGVAVIRHDGDRSVIDTFLMSCRVLGRGVEDALLVACLLASRRHGGQQVSGEFIPTAKNGRVTDFYPAHGFTDDGAGIFRLALADASFVFPSHFKAVVLDGEPVLT